MARIQRWTQKIFASGASNNGIFGSAQAGTKILSNSLSDIQSLPAWAAGWLDATIGALKFPPLEEMQGVQYLTTTQISYLFQEGIAEYDAATTYYHFSIVKAPGTFQLFGSLIDANVGNALPTAPASNGNWQFLIDLGNTNPFTTGDAKLTLKTAADIGFVMANDGTIGNAASGGTTRANADTIALFELLWNNVGATYAPMADGNPYGTSAAADFAANRAISLTKVVGRAIIGAGAGSGLTARALGMTGGEETHLLVTAEMPSHNHTYSDPTHAHTYAMQQSGSDGGSITAASNGRNSSGTTDGAGVGITINNTGGGGAHNNMQPFSAWNIMVKL